MKVSVVIPTYNERENIKLLIPKIFIALKRSKVNGNIIIVDDNSPDGTSEVVKKLQKRYRKIILIKRPKKLGIGSAYIEGFKVALNKNSEIIIEMDGDLSHNPIYIPKFIKSIKDCDVVIGSRYKKGGKIVGWNWYRKLVSIGGNQIGRYIAKIDIEDITSGFRSYKKEVLKNVINEIKSSGYAFQLEILARCIKKGFKVRTIPIIFYDRKKGKSKLSKKDILSFLLIALKIRLGMIK